MKLNRISVIMLGVGDLDKAVAFYRDKLGMTLQNQSPNFAFFDGGGVTLALSAPLAKAVETKNGAVEVVFPVDHVRAACEVLKAQGVEFRNEPRAVAGTNFAANFTDPDGHLLSLFGPE